MSQPNPTMPSQLCPGIGVNESDGGQKEVAAAASAAQPLLTTTEADTPSTQQFSRDSRADLRSDLVGMLTPRPASESDVDARQDLRDALESDGDRRRVSTVPVLIHVPHTDTMVVGGSSGAKPTKRNTAQLSSQMQAATIVTKSRRKRQSETVSALMAGVMEQCVDQDERKHIRALLLDRITSDGQTSLHHRNAVSTTIDRAFDWLRACHKKAAAEGASGAEVFDHAIGFFHVVSVAEASSAWNDQECQQMNEVIFEEVRTELDSLIEDQFGEDRQRFMEHLSGVEQYEKDAHISAIRQSVSQRIPTPHVVRARLLQGVDRLRAQLRAAPDASSAVQSANQNAQEKANDDKQRRRYHYVRKMLAKVAERYSAADAKDIVERAMGTTSVSWMDSDGMEQFKSVTSNWTKTVLAYVARFFDVLRMCAECNPAVDAAVVYDFAIGSLRQLSDLEANSGVNRQQMNAFIHQRTEAEVTKLLRDAFGDDKRRFIDCLCRVDTCDADAHIAQIRQHVSTAITTPEVFVERLRNELYAERRAVAPPALGPLLDGLAAAVIEYHDSCGAKRGDTISPQLLTPRQRSAAVTMQHMIARHLDHVDAVRRSDLVAGTDEQSHPHAAAQRTSQRLASKKRKASATAQQFGSDADEEAPHTMRVPEPPRKQAATRRTLLRRR